jgi:hypothetical protein
MTAYIEHAELLGMLMGERFASGYLLVMLPSKSDMDMMLRLMGIHQGFMAVPQLRR